MSASRPTAATASAVRGIARDLAAAGIGTLKPWQPAKIAPAFRGGPRWQIDWPEACPWILGRTIRNLRNGPSPQWLQDRLTSIGLRPINALVDITNFFTIDLGRPLHVFDVAKLTGDVLTLRPGRGETFRALNGRDYTVDAGGLRHRRCRRRAVDGRRDRRRADRLRRDAPPRSSSNARCSIRSASRSPAAAIRSSPTRASASSAASIPR